MFASGLSVLAPLAMVVAGHQLFRHVLPSKLGIAVVTWITVAYYLQWRLSTTMPWDATGAAFAWPLVCLLIEAGSLVDAAILYLALVRKVDRSAEADLGEARLRALSPAELPAVDVFIATYNEPREVLEKTILGCLALDWPSARIWVLDDGRRQWLHDYALSVGAGYITRPDNKGAKAGNINHALSVTDAPYVAVFDADFVPRRDFLMRTMGFFDDPKIGIVQVPHSFYNHDPMQANLSLRTAMPDDQRFFFEAIMPGRDGWDAAFCCGSNSVTRRSLFEAIGGGLPEGSITEDMLLTLAALRCGLVTRYLNEPLAHGLAPESITAFFVQRQRWAQGAMQILYLPQGPLGPGLRPIHRLLFLPTSWVTQSLLSLFAFVTPIVFLLFGLVPMVGADVEGVLRHAIPMVVALVGGITCLAPGIYHWAAAHVLGSFQSFRILPVALQTLIRPKGLMFKVTPKGSAAGGAGWDTGIWVAAMSLMAATAIGLLLNAHADYRIVDQTALLPMVAIWSALNIVTLLLIGMMCFQKPALRTEERFALRAEVTVLDEDGDWFATDDGDASLSGIGLAIRPDMPAFAVGQAVRVVIGGVGAVPGRVVRSAGRLAIAFEFESAEQRDRLIVQLFTGPIQQNGSRPGAWSVARAMIERLWTADLRDTGVRLAETAEDPTKLPPASRALPGRWATDNDAPAAADRAA
jgi:cellulose synthase (UDP-forming)